MDNILDVTNLELKDNNLIIHLSSSQSVDCDIFINNLHISSTNINGQKNIIHPLKYVFDDDLTIKIEYDGEKIEKFIHRDLDSYFTPLKRTMLGRDNYFFLVNDSNSEISQHYDENFKGLIDLEKFKESLESKKAYLNTKGIGYNIFVVPDKSIMLRDKLPFKTNDPRRNTELLKDYVYDLKSVLTCEDYFKNDSHISNTAALKIIPYIVSKLYNLDYEEVKHLVQSKVKIKSQPHLGDLFVNNNWSYEKDELYYDNIRLEEDTLILKDNFEVKAIPPEFKYISSKESKHFYNPNSISDKRVLVLRDSSTSFLATILVSYFREVFLYWDHWLFNKELVDYLNPDDLIEIRTERMMDKPGCPILDENYDILYPLYVSIKGFDLISDVLNMTLCIKDYRQIPQNVPVTVYIDDELVKEDNSIDGLCNISYSLDHYENGEHTLKVDVDKESIRKFSFQKQLIVYESFDSFFKNLNSSYLGIGDNLFLVNDKTNEIRQHYDKTFQSRFNLEKFKIVQNSKKSYLKNLNIPYKMFILPDKSVVLSDFLPFNHFEVLKASSFDKKSNSFLKAIASLENIKPKRIVDSIQYYVHDLKEVLGTGDYIKNDSGISKQGFIKVAAYMLHEMYQNKSWNQYQTELFKKIELVDYKHRGNLVTKKSWSYDEELRLKLYEIDSKDIELKGNYEEISSDTIPYQFREFSNLKSKYYKNKDSINKQRALIILDMTAENIILPFVAYYSETFFYFDEGYFNKDLISWFKPNIIYEIRGERNLEKVVYQKISENNEIMIPVTIQELDFSVKKNILTYEIKCADLKQIPVQSECTFLIDEEKITSIGLVDGKCTFKYDITNLNNGDHILKILLNQTSKTKSKSIIKKFKK